MSSLLPRARKAAEPQAVRDDEDARERHRARRDDRVEKPGHRERDRRDVVGERPEEIALDRAEDAPREPGRIRGRPQVAGDESDVARLHGDVHARADGEAEVGFGQRGRVVDPIPDHRDHLAGLLQPAHLVRLLAGQDPATTRSTPTSFATLMAASWESPVKRTGARPRARSWAIASALVGLTVSATDSRPARTPSTDTVPRSTSTRWPSTTPTTPRPATLRNPSTGGNEPKRARAASATARPTGCSLASSTAPARRRAPGGKPFSASLTRPSVTVPVLSRTTVVTSRVFSRTSGP